MLVNQNPVQSSLHRYFVSCLFAALLTSTVALLVHGCRAETVLEEVAAPNWSQSGRWLSLMAAGSDGDLRVLLVDSATGSTLEVLRVDGLDYEAGSWSPEVDQWYYVASESTKLGLSRRVIRSLDTEGKSRHSLELPFRGSVTNLAWSSDGENLAAPECAVSDTLVNVLSPELVARSSRDVPIRVYRAQWHPDESQTLLLHDVTQQALFSLAVDTGDVVYLTSLPKTLFWHCFPGGVVYFLTRRQLPYGDQVEGYNEIHAYDIASGTFRIVLSDQDLGKMRVDLDRVAWCAGANLAAVSSQGSIFLIDLVAPGVEQVTAGMGDSMPALTHDGARLAFVRGKQDLVVMDLRTRNTEVIFSAGSNADQ